MEWPRAKLDNVINSINDIYPLIVISMIICHIIEKVTIVADVVKDALHAKAPLSANGRIVIPAAIREEMGFAPGDTLLMDVEDGVLRIESHRRRIRRIQEEFRKHVPIKPGEMLMSDQLIAERREEARREMEEADRQIEEYRLRNERRLG